MTKNKVMKNRITLGNIRCKKFLHTHTNLYIGETEEKESAINMSKVFIVEEYSMIDERTLSVIDYLYYYPYNKDRRHKDFFDRLKDDTTLILDLINKHIRVRTAITYPFKTCVIKENKDNLSDALMGY